MVSTVHRSLLRSSLPRSFFFLFFYKKLETVIHQSYSVQGKRNKTLALMVSPHTDTMDESLNVVVNDSNEYLQTIKSTKTIVLESAFLVRIINYEHLF